MQRKFNYLVSMLVLAGSVSVYGQNNTTPPPTPVPNSTFGTITAAAAAATATANAIVNPNASMVQNPNAPDGSPFKVDPRFRPENQIASATQLEGGQVNYLRYCADCHGKEGEGNTGPRLVGSLMVTGPTFGHIAVVLSGHPQSKMPSWGISELSDEVIAGIITYQRNAWGNGNKKEYGKNAGGVVTPSQVHEYRKTMKNLPVKQDVRT